MKQTKSLVLLRIRKLPKALKDWQAFVDLKKTIDDFNESCPILEMMSHKAMKERHWKRISDVTKHPLDIQSVETFTLRVLMQAPLLKNKEDIEVYYNANLDILSLYLLPVRNKCNINPGNVWCYVGLLNS